MFAPRWKWYVCRWKWHQLIRSLSSPLHWQERPPPRFFSDVQWWFVYHAATKLIILEQSFEVHLIAVQKFDKICTKPPCPSSPCPTLQHSQVHLQYGQRGRESTNYSKPEWNKMQRLLAAQICHNFRDKSILFYHLATKWPQFTHKAINFLIRPSQLFFTCLFS